MASCNFRKGRYPLKRNGSCNADMVKSEDGRCCENCPPCPPGQGKMWQPPCVNSASVPCASCDQGTFSSKEDTELCSFCTDCQEIHRETVKKCTSLRDTKCGGCKTGYYEMNGICYRCAKNSKLVRCQNLSESTTSLITRIPMSRTNTEIESTQSEAHSSTQTLTTNASEFALLTTVSLGVMLVVVLAFMLLAFIVHFVRKMHRHTDSRQTTPSTSQHSIVKFEQAELLTNDEVTNTNDDAESFTLDLSEESEMQDLAVPFDYPPRTDEQKDRDHLLSQSNHEQLPTNLSEDDSNGSSCEIYSSEGKAHFGKKQSQHNSADSQQEHKETHFTKSTDVQKENENNVVTEQTAREYMEGACCRRQQQTRDNASMEHKVTMNLKIPQGTDFNLSLQNSRDDNMYEKCTGL